MLQKDPEKRPSAKDIFTNSLPLLVTPQEEEEETEEANDSTKTHTKYVVLPIDHDARL